MKRFFVLVLIFIFMFTGGTLCTSAEDIEGNRYEAELALMRDMGIISGYPDGSMRPASFVTRAEFTQMLIRILGYGDIVGSAHIDFYDVPENYWAYDCIGLASELKIVNGDGSGMFYPEKNVLLSEALKMIVCAVGYDIQAQKKGGWPMGYYLTASDLELLKETDLDMSNVLTRDSCARIFYNLLNVNIMELSVNGELSKGDKLFNLRAGIMEWTKGEGILTGTYETVIFDDKELEEDEVIINGRIFKKGKTQAEKYFGMYVEFYSCEDENGKERLLSVYPKKNRNNILTIKSEQIASLSDSGLTYYTDESVFRKTDKVSFVSGLKLIINGQWINGYTDSDFHISEGYLTLIDNDNDNLTDILIINRSQSFLAERISRENNLVYFKEATLNGRKSIRYNTENEDLRMNVLKNGEKVPFSDIKEGDVLTVFMSPDLNNYKIIISEKSVLGQILQRDEENSKVFINDEEFSVADTFKVKIFGGMQGGKLTEPLDFSQTYKFYIDASGRITYAEKTQEETALSYGYIMDYGLGKGMSPQLELKVLMGARTREVEDTKNKDEDKTITEAQNKSIEFLKATEKVKINGEKCTGKEAYDKLTTEGNSVISFKRTADGDVTEIEFLEKFANDGERVFNKDIMSFGKSTEQAFIIDEFTDVILVAGSDVDDDYFVSKKIIDGASYRVEGFGRRTYNGYEVDVCLLYDPTMTSVITPVNSETPASIIEKIRYVMNEHGEYVCRVSMYTDGKYEEKEIKETVKTLSKMDSLKTGTVIKYTEDSYKRIHNIDIVANLADNAGNYHINEHDATEIILAPCMKVETGMLSNIFNNMIDEIRLSVYGDTQSEKIFNVQTNDGPSYYLYDTASKTVVPANGEFIRSAEECSASDASRVFIHSYEDDVRIVVIID